jgi:hypothetical protein
MKVKVLEGRDIRSYQGMSGAIKMHIYCKLAKLWVLFCMKTRYIFASSTVGKVDVRLKTEIINSIKI